MKILVADDDAVARAVTKVAVESLGHECRTVNDGEQAWAAFQLAQPDVVISDRVMPGLTGLELCRRIRVHSSADYTYLILITGQGDPDQILEGMGAGADDYLVKPFDAAALQGRLLSASRVTSLHHSLAQQRTELEIVNRELSDIARRDALTGLGNRLALREDIEALQDQVRRYGRRYCVAVLDIDHFKSYNDSLGHQAGDEALQAVATTLREQARMSDSIYRLGGEEFLCIFPEQDLGAGARAVHRMRTEVERLGLPSPASPRGVLTVSAGVSMLDPQGVHSAQDVIKEADEALYRAKNLGRNRVEVVRYETTPTGIGPPIGAATEERPPAVASQ